MSAKPKWTWVQIASTAGAISTTIALIIRIVIAGHQASQRYIVDTAVPVARTIAAEVVHDSLDAHRAGHAPHRGRGGSRRAR